MNQNFAAIILGGTGQVGSAAVAELLAIPECREVVMVIRKPIAPRSRRNGFSGDHHHFPAFRNCQQLRDRCTTNLPSTTEDNRGKILIHREDLCLGKDATASFNPREKHTWYRF